MAGQFSTRRNADTGRLEKVPAEEQEGLRAEAESADQLRRDQDFQQRAGDMGMGGGIPAEEKESVIGGAVQGAVVGSAFGPIGTAVGAAVGGGKAALSNSMKDSAIGTLEGGNVSGGNRMQELLDVTKQIAKVGTPIKNKIITAAKGSRM